MSRGGFGRGGGSSGGFGGGFGSADNNEGGGGGFFGGRGGSSGGFGRGGGSTGGFGGDSNDAGSGGFGEGQFGKNESSSGGFGAGRGSGSTGGFSGGNNDGASGGFGGGRGGNSVGFGGRGGSNNDGGSGFGGGRGGTSSGGFGGGRGGGKGGGSGDNNEGGGFGGGRGGRSGGGFGGDRENKEGGFAGGGFGGEKKEGGFGGGGRGGGRSGGFGGGNNESGFGSGGFGEKKEGGFGGGRGGGRSGGFGGGDNNEGFGGDRPRRQRNEDGEFGKVPEGGFGGKGPRNETEGGKPEKPYIPKARDVNDIFNEDEQSKQLYENIGNEDEDVIVTGYENLKPFATFEECKFDSTIVDNLKHAGYVKPRKIQAYTIPIILEGKDLKAQAETGSGKSAAFLLPTIQKIVEEKKTGEEAKKRMKHQPYAIIVEPTRELAIQLYEQGRKLANDTGVSVVKCYGEYHFKENAEEIMLGADIIAGTPGRLLHFMEEGIIDPISLKILVLDEADRILDEQFKLLVEKMREIPNFPKKENLQTLLYSATFEQAINDWAQEQLREGHVNVHNKNRISANARVKQAFVSCLKSQKKDKVAEMLPDIHKELKEKSGNPEIEFPRTLIFVEKKRDADVMSSYLSMRGFKSTTINGDRPQRLREEALQQFKGSDCPIMVATDVMARGLDIKDLDFVINMDLPQDTVTYVHRIGRTGRLRQGRAISLFDPENDNDRNLAKTLTELLKDDGNDVPEFIEKAEPPTEGENAGFGSGFGGAPSGGFGNNEVAGFGSAGFGDGGGFGNAPSSGFGDGFGKPEGSGGFGGN